jgi:hypothetical protein
MILSTSASGNTLTVVVRTFPRAASDKRNFAMASSSVASVWMNKVVCSYGEIAGLDVNAKFFAQLPGGRSPLWHFLDGPNTLVGEIAEKHVRGHGDSPLTKKQWTYRVHVVDYATLPDPAQPPRPSRGRLESAPGQTRKVSRRAKRVRLSSSSRRER